MSFQSWFVSLPTNLKLVFALAVGISIYALFRYFIHVVNKNIRELGMDKTTKLNERQKLDYLIREHSG